MMRGGFYIVEVFVERLQIICKKVFLMFLFDTSMLIYIFSIYMYCMVFVTVSKIKIRKVSDTASSTV